MPASGISRSAPSNLINRNDLIQLLERSLSSGNFRFIQKISKAWLEKYPHDITFQYFIARSSIFDQEQKKICEILNTICARDPEHLKAWELKLKLSSNENVEEQNLIRTILYALGNDYSVSELYEWGKNLRELRHAQVNSKSVEEINELIESLDSVNSTPLVGIFHLKSLKPHSKNEEFINYAQNYHQKWPECIAISLWLADSMLVNGKEKEAVSLLHSCAVMDPGGDILRRMWGNNNEYLSMWPKNMDIELAIPVPQQISKSMNWKQLPSGENNPGKDSQEEATKIRKIIDNINIFHKRNDSAKNKKIKDESSINYIEKDLDEIFQKSVSQFNKSDSNKKPVYVILSIKKQLEKKYGEKSFSVLSTELRKMVDSMKLNPEWEAIIFYPDDVNCMRLFDLDALNEVNPWKIKLSLVDLDKSLGTKGQRIGCVLIIGGGDIIPFHALPNPTDDKDKEVLSDNPYSTLDSNYFVPEWPVGRLPGEKTNDPGLLLKQIRQIITLNKNRIQISGWWNIIFNWLMRFRNPLELIKSITTKSINYGYSASIWRRSSLASFRPIGTGNHLRVTPPFDSSNLDIDLLKKSKYAYFNLHGLPDTPEWYGQKDISESNQSPDFPIAISAGQIKAADSIPSVVFSEACYGGFIENKEIDESLALKFKDVGSEVFIGSTCISYGSINTPLVGADLLAFIFWKYLLDGFTSGEAFMRAKVNFAQVMMQRQGYLDGEDQKILLSFVHYGDPLSLSGNGKTTAKSMPRSTELMKVTTITDHDFVETRENRLSGEVISKVKNDLKSYLPGIELADVKIHPHQRSGAKTNSEFGKNILSTYALVGHMKITYHQPVTYQRITHDQYTRVTVDLSGKMVKLVTSR